MLAIHVMQLKVTTKMQQQQTRGQLTFFLVIEDQRTTPFTLMLTKIYPTSVASAKCQQKISGLSNFFGINLQSVMSYQQIDTLQPFSPADTPASVASPPTTTSAQQEHQWPPAQLQHPLQSAGNKQQQQDHCHCCEQFKGPF